MLWICCDSSCSFSSSSRSSSSSSDRNCCRCNQIFGLMTSAPAPFSSRRLSSELHHAIYGSGPSVHRTQPRNTPFPPPATEFCTNYVPQEHDEDAHGKTPSSNSLYGNVKPVEGGVGWCSPPETRLLPAGTPVWSRKHNLYFDGEEEILFGS